MAPHPSPHPARPPPSPPIRPSPALNPQPPNPNITYSCLAIVIAPSKPAVPPLHPHTHAPNNQPTNPHQPLNPAPPTKDPNTHTSPRRILQQRRIDRRPGQMHISYHTPSDKDVLDRRLYVHTRRISNQPKLAPSSYRHRHPHPLLPRPALTACRKRGVGR